MGKYRISLRKGRHPFMDYIVEKRAFPWLGWITLKIFNSLEEARQWVDLEKERDSKESVIEYR